MHTERAKEEATGNKLKSSHLDLLRSLNGFFSEVCVIKFPRHYLLLIILNLAGVNYGQVKARWQ